MMNIANASCGRLDVALDMNLDGVFTISDLWLLIKFVWLLPSKLVMEVIGASPKLVQFFEIDCYTGEGFGGAILSLFIWLIGYSAFTQSHSG
jgi:hypothetical protein